MVDVNRYFLDEVYLDIAAMVTKLAREKYSEPGNIVITIGKRTIVKSHKRQNSQVFDLTTVDRKFLNVQTEVQISLNFLIKYSKGIIAFNEIPLRINDPCIPPIMKMILEKRLALGE